MRLNFGRWKLVAADLKAAIAIVLTRTAEAGAAGSGRRRSNSQTVNQYSRIAAKMVATAAKP